MKKYLEIIIIFIITLIFYIFVMPIEMDTIWNFGFAYNILNGLTPYVDFNMVVGPVSPLLSSLFMFIFGKNLLVYMIYISIICTVIFIFIKKTNNRICYLQYLLLLLLLIFNSPYNIICLLLLYLIIYLEKKPNKDYLIGILLALAFLTKMNVGVFICLPSLFIKDFDRLLKRILSFSLVILISLLTMKIIGNLNGFLNYTILGLFDFGSKNLRYDPFSLCTFIFDIIILLYLYFIKKNKDITILYLLCFHIISYPIFDLVHVFIAFIPILGYLLKEVKINKAICLTIFYTTIFFTIIDNFLPIIKEDKIFDSDSILFKYKPEQVMNIKSSNHIVNYLNNIDKNVKVFIFSPTAYLYKLESNRQINKFDLINNGNMGYHGKDVYINEIYQNCHKNKCLFLLEEYNSKTQTNKDILDYVIKNYEYIENIEGLKVYGGQDA